MCRWSMNISVLSCKYNTSHQTTFMKTSLVEFKGKQGNILRGIHILSQGEPGGHVVVMMGGFERAATTERKFKLLSDELVDFNIDSFRFDVSDIGMSDGDFYESSTRTFADDLLSAMDCVFGLGYKTVSFVGHSHASAALSLVLHDVDLKKIVLIAPGANQKTLWQMWHVKETNPNKTITVSNYEEYFDEQKYRETLDDVSWTDLLMASHDLSPKLRAVNSYINYFDNYAGYPAEKIMIIHGTHDLICPYETVTAQVGQTVLVEGGDHDLEKPAMSKQWVSEAIKHLSS